MNNKNISIGIVSYHRPESLNITLANLIGIANGMTIYLALGALTDVYKNNPYFEQIVGAYKQMGGKIIILNNKKIKLECGRKLLIETAKEEGIDWLIMSDDDFLIDNKLLKKTIKYINEIEGLNGFMPIHPNGYPIRETTLNYTDDYIKCAISFSKFTEYLGGWYAINLDNKFNFKFNLKQNEPGEDRMIFKDIPNKYIFTELNAYHMTSKELGSHYDYKKYFGEENKYWK